MKALIAILAAAAALAAAGCGSSVSGGARDEVLRVGTTSGIDSLNPFVGIEGQAFNAATMVYPQLVEYGPHLAELQGDWAERWSRSRDGRRWTFELKEGRWSDGRPLTAADAAWTGNTILEYQDGPAAALAGALANVTRLEAPDERTLVIRYERPVANALAQLDQLPILPRHVWEAATGNGGRDLRTFRPPLPLVAGGPYTITEHDEKGTTVFKRNAGFYGKPSNAAAVALTYYADATAMVRDVSAGELDFVDQLPFTAAAALERDGTVDVSAIPGPEVVHVGFNSNPDKPRHRELLDPRVREALEYATDRARIVDVVFRGYAEPWANMVSKQSEGAGWLSPDVRPLPFDVERANRMLDALGYRRGEDGVRMVPATGGRFAEPAHPMRYELLVPGSLNFSGERMFGVIRDGWAQAGVELRMKHVGDARQAFAAVSDGDYTRFDLVLWNWVHYVDPDSLLGVLTKAQWGSFSDTGYADGWYDRAHRRQATLLDADARRGLIWRMQEHLRKTRPYIQLVNEQLVTASSPRWTDFHPDAFAYCKCYYTDPRPR